MRTRKDGKPPRRSRSVFERLNYFIPALGVMLADIRLVDPLIQDGLRWPDGLLRRLLVPHPSL